MISRTEAIELELPHYFTGRPCKYGHVAARYTSSGTCIECPRTPDQLEKRRVRQRKWYAGNKEQQRRLNWKNRGLPEPTRPNPGHCECCGAPESKRGRALHLDHDHETGRFRGWLCANCNLGIGKLGDDAAGVQRALSYLELVKFL